MGSMEGLITALAPADCEVRHKQSVASADDLAVGRQDKVLACTARSAVRAADAWRRGAGWPPGFS